MITDKDSLGNQLTKEQIEYFKDSKVVDSHNNLLVCYHGSPNAGFREFDPRSKKSRFGLYKFGDANVNYFTTDKSSASSYTDMGYDDGTVYQVYLNITNPYIVDNKSEAEIKSFLNIKDNTLRDKQVRLFDRIFNKWKGKIIDYSDYRFNELNKDLHKLNLELKPSEGYDEDTDPMDIEYFDLWNLGRNSFIGAEHVLEYQYGTDELFDDDMYDQLKEEIIGDGDDYYFTTDDIVRYVLTMNEEDGADYDGIIIKDIMDSTSMFSNIATDYITLQSSNQIKDITNKTPSSSNNIDEKLDEAWTPEEQKERRLLWKSPTYTKDPKPNTTRLIHQTDKNNIQSILRNGLLGSKRRPFDNPSEDVIWAGKEMPFDSMWNYGNCAIEFDLPNDFDFRPVNGSDYQIYQDIPPKYFNAIYLASPYRKEIMKDFQNTLDIDKSIDRFQQGLLTEILHIDYKKMFGSSSLQESQGKTYYVPQEYKDLLVNDAKRYGWLDGENSYEFKVLSLDKIMEANKLKNNPNHGMFYRRADRWGTDPNEYHYTPSKEDWLYSPIRVRGDYRIIDGGHRLYALYNDGYDYVEVLVPKGSLFESLSLTEASRNDLISKAKRGKEYKDKSKGRNRWERKKYSRVASTTKEYNSIDMNTFFKKDILTVNIPIRGETDNYTVRVKFGGALKEIQNTVKRNNNRLDYKSISQALVRCFNGENVYVFCNCPDWTYRMNWYSQKNGFDAARPREEAPYQNQFEWTNRYDDMGGICKHVALVISNTFWLMKVASVINNYIHYAETYMQRQFADIIFPKIYGVKYPDAVQLGLFDRQYLKHSKGVIDEINNYGKGRGRFKKKPQPEQKEVEFRTHPKQLTIFDVKEEEDVEKKPSFKKQTIYDYGVEENETEEEAKPKFKPQNSKQPTLNKGYKQLSLFDDEEEEK